MVMFLSHSFNEALRVDFEQAWAPLLAFINDNAYGAVSAPYKLRGNMIANLHGDVELRIVLARTAGGQADGWKDVACRSFYNTNDAGKLGFLGAAFRIVRGRSMTLSEGTSLLPLKPSLKLGAMDVAQGKVREWARDAVCQDKDSRPKLRMVVNN